MDWWAHSNASWIIRICSAVHEILADKAFTATDVLISQSFVVAFVHPIYVWIVLIWDFLVQLGLWKLVHWLWRYKLNKVCDTFTLLSWTLYGRKSSRIYDILPEATFCTPKTTPVFHVVKLTPAPEDSISGRYSSLPLDSIIINREEE